jgi:hypothetical protein
VSKATTIRKKALDLVRQQDWANAIKEYRRLVELDQNNPNVHNELADLYLKTGQKAEAFDSFVLAVDEYTRVGLYNNAVAARRCCACCRRVEVLNLDLFVAPRSSPGGGIVLPSFLESVHGCSPTIFEAGVIAEEMPIRPPYSKLGQASRHASATRRRRLVKLSCCRETTTPRPANARASARLGVKLEVLRTAADPAAAPCHRTTLDQTHSSEGERPVHAANPRRARSPAAPAPAARRRIPRRPVGSRRLGCPREGPRAPSQTCRATPAGLSALAGSSPVVEVAGEETAEPTCHRQTKHARCAREHRRRQRRAAPARTAAGIQSPR